MRSVRSRERPFGGRAGAIVRRRDRSGAGAFGAVYDVLKALEDAGRVRRGYFVGAVGATQFAVPAALDLLRSLRETPEDAEVVTMAATDPANPYGTTLQWPQTPGEDAAG